ncbi:MAG: hypothetical protein ACI36X_03930 [Bacteroidaceae bacterium]
MKINQPVVWPSDKKAVILHRFRAIAVKEVLLDMLRWTINNLIIKQWI